MRRALELTRAAVAGLVLAAFIVGATSCAHAPSPLVVTGHTLDAAGLTFETVAAGMQSASDRNALTREQVLAWNDFLARWKAGYKGAAALWRAAKDTNDEGLAQQAAAVLTTLLGQLGQWQVLVAGGISYELPREPEPPAYVLVGGAL